MNNADSIIASELENHRAVVSLTEGDSMEPLLYTGKTTVLIEKNDADLKKHDISLYRRPDGKFVMHRVVRVKEDFYITRGDNRFTSERVPKDWVLGVVTQISRKGKTFDVTNKKYRLYVRFWSVCFPFRVLYYVAREAKHHFFN